jgi:hypothetical protein
MTLVNIRGREACSLIEPVSFPISTQAGWAAELKREN